MDCTPAAPSAFTAHVYLRDPDGYSERRKVAATGSLAEGRQHLRFGLPAAAAAVRLDPAEQGGFLQLHAMRLVRDGATAWEWQADAAGWRDFADWPRHQWLPAASSPGVGLLGGTDPWVELPIPASLLADAGAVLEVEVAWLLSAAALPGADAALLAVQGLAAQAAHTRDLARQLAEARHLHVLARGQARRLAQDKAALRRQLSELRPAPEQPLAATVDVVVPVYLDLTETRRCIESVLAAPVRTPWRLVLVNDASPEPGVTDWLRELAARDGRVLLLENPENLGYSGAVNRGITCSDLHDVVLLNSDAEVANDWLDRLRAAAYRTPRVGSVTPFSNNATICSFPRFCEANALPSGWRVGALDAVFAEVNRHQAVEIPTAVGFCMYVRRDCLRDVGLFDMDLFGKGYGEENDFCLRAQDAGWRDLHALDVFVQHTGGVSFGASKPQREIDALVVLRQLYPEYEPAVHAYIRADPPAAARARVEAALAAHRRAVAPDPVPGAARHPGGD